MSFAKAIDFIIRARLLAADASVTKEKITNTPVCFK